MRRTAGRRDESPETRVKLQALLDLTFAVIVTTLVGQGLTLPALIRRLKVGSNWSLHDEQVRVRAAMSAAALAAIDEVMAAEHAPAEWAHALKAEIADRIALAASEDTELTPRMELVNRLRPAAIKARVWHAPCISSWIQDWMLKDGAKTDRIRIIRRLDFTKQARIDATYEEHAKILKAIQRKRGDQAAMLLRAHIETSQAEVRKITLHQVHLARQGGLAK